MSHRLLKIRVTAIFMVFILTVSCTPSSRTKNEKEILRRLFHTDNMKNVTIDHFFLLEGTLGASGTITAILSMPASDFFLLIEKANAQKLNIPRGDEAARKSEFYYFDNHVNSTLPRYESQPNGIPISDLKTVYKIKSALDVPDIEAYSGVPREVESYIVVDDRLSTDYTLFICMDINLHKFKVK